MSVPLLPATKVVWEGKIRFGIRCFILRTRILDTILYMVLQRLIGLKWLIDSGPSCLGIRAIRVLLS